MTKKRWIGLTPDEQEVIDTGRKVRADAMDRAVDRWKQVELEANAVDRFLRAMAKGPDARAKLMWIVQQILDAPA